MKKGMRIVKRTNHLALAILSAVIVLSMSACGETKKMELASPDESFQFALKSNDAGGELSYSLSYHGKEVISESKLGFVFAVEDSATYKLGDAVFDEINTEWRPVYGEREIVPDIYKEMLVPVYRGEELVFNFRVRAYNEGAAFRYEFNNGSEKIVEDELTSFGLDPEASAWVSKVAQGEILKHRVKKLDKVYNRPLLLEYNDSLFLALGEAANVDFARMNFSAEQADSGILKAELTRKVTSQNKGKAYPVTIPAGAYNSPWRFVMAGRSAGDLLENNYFILNLNEENKIKDTSWIKPGKVIREVTLTTDGGKACVDFAVKHNLGYIEFDAGWYGHEFDANADATTVTVDHKRSPGPLDLPEVINYAKKNDVGVILYVNRRAMEKQLDDILDFTSGMGVAGLKYGFVNVGPQEWTSWLHDAVRKAADHKLMIDIHDEYRPTGYSRTYPNLMTQEGIRGDEESTPNSMVLNTIFTRMIAGAGDHTNCYFAERVAAEMGSHASQMAKTICIYSPWQFLFWYDRPLASPRKKGDAGDNTGRIMELSDLAFYDQVPTVWDETKVLSGYPGEHVVMARRSGEDWFLAILNGNTVKDYELSLDFLDENTKYESTSFFDDKTLNSITNVGIEVRNFTNGDKIETQVGMANGFVAVLKPVNE